MVVGYATDTLGVDPVATLTTRTGTAAIMTLVLSLACTPANMLFGWRKALTVRKSLGLWAFTYAALHMLVFIGLDYGLDWRFIWQDALLEKRVHLRGLDGAADFAAAGADVHQGLDAASGPQLEASAPIGLHRRDLGRAALLHPGEDRQA
ncbi:MAG: hypothetical protein R3A10_10735 [Caldilineaceae bacterium]